MNLRIFLFFIAGSLLVSGCSDDVKRGLSPTPIAFGNINTIQVIADEDVWEGPIGDTLRFYYSAAYPILPQPEPIFDLKHFTPIKLNQDPILKELRNYLIIANLADEDSPTTRMLIEDIGEEKIQQSLKDSSFHSMVGREKWARGQLLIYLYENSADALINNLKKNFPAVSRRFQKADENKVEATVYIDGESRKLREEVRAKMDAEMRVPADYVQAISDSTVIWLRKELPEISSNLILSKVAYTDQSQLTKEGIKQIRNEIGKQYVSSTLPNTYMRINDEDLPIFTSHTNINDNFALEARGIWEIANDFMGGAFISYLIYNPEKKDLLFIDGFVYAPGKDKRNQMEYLNHIIHTIKY